MSYREDMLSPTIQNLKPRLIKVLNILLDIAFWCCMLILVWIFCLVFCFASFKIPTDSMEPTLVEGDNILVNKTLYGPRLFNLSKSFRKEDIDIYRVPGLKKIKRNDVIVFNFPFPAHWDSIGFDVTKYYVKRCIALPGDTLIIRNAHYSVSGCKDSLGNIPSQKFLAGFLRKMTNDNPENGEAYQGIYIKAYPPDPAVDWNIRDFGPFYIPRKGEEIELTPMNILLYKTIIEWEQKQKLTIEEDCAYLNGEPLHNYCFRENYYFTGGDKTENSQDSRYWGLLPEEYIVGKATYIWKSKNPFTGKTRWERVFKRIE